MENEFLLNQLIKLGDMMGDGLHHEPGGKWISKEYNKILKSLNPELFKEKRKAKSEVVDKQIQELILIKKCKCGGSLIQRRKGTKVVYCIECQSRYIAVTKKI